MASWLRLLVTGTATGSIRPVRRVAKVITFAGSRTFGITHRTASDRRLPATGTPGFLAFHELTRNYGKTTGIQPIDDARGTRWVSLDGDMASTEIPPLTVLLGEHRLGLFHGLALKKAFANPGGVRLRVFIVRAGAVLFDFHPLDTNPCVGATIGPAIGGRKFPQSHVSFLHGSP